MFSKLDDTKYRIEERLDVLWDAEISIEDETHTCEVANVSTAGALLKLDIDISLEQEFLLNVPKLGEFAGVITWVNKPFYGLQLLVGPDLDLKTHADNVGLTAKGEE